MRDELYAEMFSMEQTHWWFTARHAIVTDLLRRYLPVGRNGHCKPKVADLGCGCGMMLSRLQHEMGYDVVGVDGSPTAVAFSTRRGVRVEPGFLPTDVPLPRQTFDVVLMLDVLEHLDDDHGSAKLAASLLRPGGILICTVPAYQWLWSPRDVHHQHRRRYSPSQFRALFDQPDLRVEILSHMNALLFPCALPMRLYARLRKVHGMNDLTIPRAPFNSILRYLFAAERGLLGRLNLPFGLSLVALSRKQ